MKLPTERIEDLCRRHNVAELAVFGSALRDDFNSSSDVDFLVSFVNDDYGPWLSNLQNLQSDLSKLLERPADVVPKDSLKWVIRDQVLSEAQVIYAK